jgi:hypothetical protein
MDPNAALNLLRELSNQIDLATDDHTTTALAMDMIAAFEGLDNWIKMGGALPDDWSKRNA